MRKLLNTIYVTNEQMYLMLDGENLVCKAEGEIKLRIPFENVENIVCFSYLGCSPALMGKCVEKLIPINFMSPQGKFLAKVCGETKGNVFLRVELFDGCCPVIVTSQQSQKLSLIFLVKLSQDFLFVLFLQRTAVGSEDSMIFFKSFDGECIVADNSQFIQYFAQLGCMPPA